MVKNLNQLKKVMKGNPRFQIIAHCRKECVGEIRQVTQTNTAGFYSAVASDPENWTRTANRGRGLILWWNAASFWNFQDGVCSAYDSDTTHTEDHLIMAFRILDEQEEAAQWNRRQKPMSRFGL